MAQICRASLSGLCRAKRDRFESRSTVVNVISTIYFLLRFLIPTQAIGP